MALPLRVLLVDDHKILREGLKAILERAGDFKVVAEAGDGREAVRLCRDNPPDLVVMDIELPGISGIDATREMRHKCPSAKVIILSMHDDEESVVSAMRWGARGFVLKKAASAEVMAALHIVARGGSYLSPQVSDRLLARIQSGDMESRTSLLTTLTPRQVQVLRLIAEGKSSKEIADVLQLSTETVRSYRKAMMRKLTVTNVAGLMQVAIRAGLTPWSGHNAPKA